VPFWAAAPAIRIHPDESFLNSGLFCPKKMLCAGEIALTWIKHGRAKAYLGYRPSKKSIKRMVENVHALTTRSLAARGTLDLEALMTTKHCPAYPSIAASGEGMI
jgi:hypothetical protein